jgi:F-type H+-transporting ATPase subunit b
MHFNLWTFLFEAINFVVLAYVLRWLLYRPLRQAIDRRREADAKARADAEKARTEAEELHGQLAVRLAQATAESQAMVHKAREQAEAERRTVLSDAEQAVQRRREEVRQALDREREEALQALHGEVVGQAVELTRRLLQEAADRTLDRQLAGRLIETLRDIPDGEREELRRQWRPADGAVLETAAELDGATLDKVHEAVTAVVGQAAAPVVTTNPDLLGGVRLRMGGHVWDASLAGQLPRPGRNGRGGTGHV